MNMRPHFPKRAVIIGGMPYGTKIPLLDIAGVLSQQISLSSFTYPSTRVSIHLNDRYSIAEGYQ